MPMAETIGSMTPPLPAVTCCGLGDGTCGCDDVGRRAILEAALAAAARRETAAAGAAVVAPAPLRPPPAFHRHDIVALSPANKLMQVPWFAAIDRGRRALVVAIRGTLSLDCLLYTSDAADE